MNVIVRVVLDTEEDDVFRDIHIPKKLPLEALHHAIIQAFDLQRGELSSFLKSDKDWNQGREISLMDLGMQEEHDLMENYTIGDLLDEKEDRALFVYDFLHLWTFFVEVLSTNTNELEAPQVLLAHGVRPAEAPSKQHEAEDLSDPFADMGDDFEDDFDEEDFY